MVRDGAVTTETGFCVEYGKVPAGAHSNIYTSGSGVPHTEYDLVTFLRQGPSNKDSDRQSGLFPYMQRCDEAAGLDKLCWSGTTTDKITLTSLTVLAQEELQDSSQTVQGLNPSSEVTQALHL